MNARPYATFVSYFRNDSYTSDFDLRVRRATSFLVRQLQRASVESELILVEWNPPPDRPLIIESLDPLPQGGCVQVRGVIVGMLLGSMMCLSNLYVFFKTGWSMGVTLTACILAFAVFQLLHATRIPTSLENAMSTPA